MQIGGYNWADLTVKDADSIRDFYTTVIGYTHTSVPMGEYNDYCMNSPSDGETKTGICHQMGTNENLPPVWMIYFNVLNLDLSLQQVTDRGGKIISGPKSYGGSSKYAIIQDPAGAYCALYQAS